MCCLSTINPNIERQAEKGYGGGNFGRSTAFIIGRNGTFTAMTAHQAVSAPHSGKGTICVPHISYINNYVYNFLSNQSHSLRYAT